MAIAVLYEHPEWFQPLFATLDRRGLEFERIDAATLAWNPAVRPGFSLLVNRMSPSAYLRGHGHAIRAVEAYLGYVESADLPVVNGSVAYRLETSKAAQLDLFEHLGVPYPRAWVVNRADQVLAAARALRFPVLLKPNIGGSGAGIVRFESAGAIERALRAGAIDLGIDQTALVQEALPARDGAFTRVEILDRELLYAIRITPPPDHGFNLCPADICQDWPQEAGVPVGGLCATRPAMKIERAEVPPGVERLARAIARSARLDICGIEYVVDDRDGRPYFYDVNALSNFVTDAPRIVGFDPFERFVDYLERRLSAPPRHVARAAVG